MKTEYPLLKGYLRSSPSHPPHVPAWITPTSWAVFAALGVTLAVGVELGCVGVGIAGAFAYAFDHFMRSRYKPQNQVEEVEDTGFKALRRLKGKLDDGLHKKLPKRVLSALEDAVQAHNAGLAKLGADHPHLHAEQTGHLRRCLHACFIAAATVMRDDQHSRKEWQALNANTPHLDEIVSAINLQIERMREPMSFELERLAALHELQEDSLPHQHRLG